MSRVTHGLQRLLEKARSRAGAQAALLTVQSGDGRIAFKGSAGPATPDIRFPIASISETATAAMIRQLVDERRLAPGQTVRSLLPEVALSGLHGVKGVDHGPRLTARRLPFQTSGLANHYEGCVGEDLIRGGDHAYDLSQALRWTRAKPPQAAPDSGRAHCSDTNYQLLGAIIEAVIGLSYGEALRRRICAPLGLDRAALFDAGRDGRGQTLAIYHKARRLEAPRRLTSMGPDGGIVSDMDDLMIFLRAFMAGGLFRPDGAPSLRKWHRLNLPMDCGGGLMRFRSPGWMTPWPPTHELIGHAGASGSFAFHAVERDIFLVGTFNQADAPKGPSASW